MKVRKLIEQLKQLEPDSSIWILNDVEMIEPSIDVVDSERLIGDSEAQVGDYYFDVCT